MRSSLFAALATVLAATVAAAQTVPTFDKQAVEVAPLTVRGVPLQRNLTITVGGDVDRQTMVTSAPLGVWCGGGIYRQQRRGSFDQCWMHVKPGREVLLAAMREGRHGRDWTVQWVGCEPLAGGAACRLTLDDDASVAAVITNRTPAG